MLVFGAVKKKMGFMHVIWYSVKWSIKSVSLPLAECVFCLRMEKPQRVMEGRTSGTFLKYIIPNPKEKFNGNDIKLNSTKAVWYNIYKLYIYIYINNIINKYIYILYIHMCKIFILPKTNKRNLQAIGKTCQWFFPKGSRGLWASST